MKIGSKVRNVRSGKVGEVVLVKVPGMSDCALVRFSPMSDGLCIPRMQLEVVEENKPRLHFAGPVERNYSHYPLCVKPRTNVWGRAHSRAWTTRDRTKVTCPRCLKKMESLPVAEAVTAD